MHDELFIMYIAQDKNATTQKGTVFLVMDWGKLSYQRSVDMLSKQWKINLPSLLRLPYF